MDADLDLLLTTFSSRPTISCHSGERTPREASQTQRSSRSASPSDHGNPSDRRFLAVARSAWTPLPAAAEAAGYFKRRRKLADTLEWLMGIFASKARFQDDLLLIDSTPVECAAAARR